MGAGGFLGERCRTRAKVEVEEGASLARAHGTQEAG